MNKKSITVVGAGAWGSWTAFFLQSNGYDVTLVDRWGAGNANSGSGGETRIIRTVYGGDEDYTRMAHRSFQLWHQYLSQWNANLYHEAGSLWLSQQKHDYVTSSVKPMKELGYDLQEVTLERAQQTYPQLNFEGIGSLYYEPTCGYLEARKACRVVVNEFKKLGGNYLTDRIISVQGAERIESLSTESKLKLKSDFYVFACGPWIIKLFPELEKYIYVSRQEVFFFRDELLRSGSKLPMWLEFQPDNDMYYGIPDHFNRGFKISYDSRHISFDPDKEDRNLTPELTEKMRNYLGLRFPAMKNAPLIEGRVCQYENSLDGDYIIDFLPNASNALFLAGSSGHGYKMAPAIGETVLDYFEKKTDLMSRFKLSRFDNLSNKKTQFD